MEYVSTRNHETPVSGPEAILRGIAPDGGLYLPVSFDRPFAMEECVRKSATGIAEQVFSWFFDEFSPEEIADIVRRSYQGKFETEDLTPLVRVGDFHVLELFRGPTSAFKDVALSALPVLMSESKKKLGRTEEIVILTATSGDTGKAAMAGFQDVPGIRIIVFYPYGGVSRIQELQMATQEGANVLACAVRGNFDECQTGVKSIFNRVNREGMPSGINAVLSSANSINIGRLVPQIVYYIKAYSDLLKNGELRYGEPVDFTVPTGNFGDILAGYFAKILGLPVGRLLCASNENNILTDFIETGRYDKNRPFYKTSSPSMDILVSSNLERLLSLLADRNDEMVREWMTGLDREGVYEVPDEVFNRLRADFAADFADEVESADTIREVFAKYKYLLDPHTAVAWTVAEKIADRSAHNVILSTASPYKFPKAVLGAIGEHAPDDEFEMIRRLHELSGITAPVNLTSLQGKPVRFTDVVSGTGLYDYVMEKIAE